MGNEYDWGHAHYWPHESEVDHWVSAGKAWGAIGNELSKLLECPPAKGREHASAELLALLQSGAIRARARDSNVDLNIDANIARQSFVPTCQAANQEIDGEAILAGDFDCPDLCPSLPLDCELNGAIVVHPAFWHFAQSHTEPINWATGLFASDGGVVLGVEFALCDLPCSDAVRAAMGLGQLSSTGMAKASNRGRKPAEEKYARFAAELALQLVEEPDFLDDNRRVLAKIVERIFKRMEPQTDPDCENILGARQAREVVKVFIERLDEDRGTFSVRTKPAKR